MFRLSRIFVLTVAMVFAASCSAVLRDPPTYEFFGDATPGGDPWYDKIDEWQRRSRVEADTDVTLEAGRRLRGAQLDEKLSVKMAAYETGERRQLASRINDFSRKEGRWHYRHDKGAGPADDHWPTVSDLLETNGDDCDGLDLIAYQLLVEFGFDRTQLYRAIVRSDKGTGNHMVTLWFDAGADDPWVFDATGAVTTKMVRFSQIFGWYPVKVFNEHDQYTVDGNYRRRVPGPKPVRGR